MKIIEKEAREALTRLFNFEGEEEDARKDFDLLSTLIDQFFKRER